MIGQTVSHFRITDELGAGGMGVVYRAEDTRLDRTVALKFLPPHLTADESARTRFVHEAKAASSFEHPAICSIFEIDETDDGHTFMVMPCYEGQTLADRLADGPLAVDEAMVILEEAYENKSNWITRLGWLRDQSGWSVLRDDPRFEELMKKIGIPI